MKVTQVIKINMYEIKDNGDFRYIASIPLPDGIDAILKAYIKIFDSKIMFDIDAP